VQHIVDDGVLQDRLEEAIGAQLSRRRRSAWTMEPERTA
jgi:hypothetical protein